MFRARVRALKGAPSRLFHVFEAGVCPEGGGGEEGTRSVQFGSAVLALTALVFSMMFFLFYDEAGLLVKRKKNIDGYRSSPPDQGPNAFPSNCRTNTRTPPCVVQHGKRVS